MSEFQRFAAEELDTLRAELLQSGLDHYQAAELLSAFLAARGYGVSSAAAHAAASRIEALGCKLPHLAEELEKLAWVM